MFSMPFRLSIMFVLVMLSLLFAAGSVSAITINPSSIDVIARLNTSVSTTFTVVNNNNFSVVNLQPSYSGISGLDVTFNDTIFALAPNSQKDILVTVMTPASAQVQKQAGVITVSNGQTSVSNTFTVDVRSMLAIENLDVKFGDLSAGNIRDGEAIGVDAEPGMPLEFSVRLRNEFPSDTDSDLSHLRNVYFKITLIELDNGDDVVLESDDFEINAQQAKTNTLYYTVPLVLDGGTYDVEIYAEGEDGDHVLHTDTWNLRISVDKKSHDIKIINEHLTRGIVDCTRSTDVVFDLLNTGDSDENAVYVKVQNSDLGISMVDGPYMMESGIDTDTNKLTKQFRLDIPSTAKAGKYNIDIRAYYLSNLISAIKVVPLEIRDCSPPGQPATGGSTQGGSPAGNGTSTSGTQGAGQGAAGGSNGTASPGAGATPGGAQQNLSGTGKAQIIDTSAEKTGSFERSIYFTAFLIIINVALLLVIGLLAVRIFGRKK
jgi:hypothetical protein